MKNSSRKTKIITMLIAMVMTLFACSEKEHRQENQPVSEENETMVVFSLSTPGEYAKKTRAISEIEENRINSVEVLVFDMKGRFIRQADAEKVPGGTESTDPEHEQLFSVELNTGIYNLVFLANSAELIENAYSGSDGKIPAGENRTAIEGKLKAAAQEWIAESGKSEYLDVPMFGELERTEIYLQSEFNQGNPIYMLRMLVKIDVTVLSDAQSEFELESIHLYNRNTEGYAIPNTTSEYWDGNAALKPTIEGLSRTRGPLVYDGTARGKTMSKTGCVSEIFTFEAPKGTISRPGHLGNTCMVVGGTYNGTNGPQESYYRIDFAQTVNGRVTYMDLLRNYWYDVRIKGVSAAGYPTAEEAFTAGMEHISVDIVAWEEGGMNNMETDGVYELRTDKNELHFVPEGGEMTIYVSTNHPDGWKITRKEDWMTLVSGDDGELKVRVDPTDLKFRSGTFTVTAGRLSKEIRVTQDESGSSVTIEVNPTTLVFRRDDKEKTFTVTTYPDNMVLYMKGSENEGKVVWLSGFGPEDHNEYQGQGAVSTFTLKPEDNDKGRILNSFITIWVEYNGQFVPAILNVQQMAYSLLYDIVTTNPYPHKGGDDMLVKVKTEDEVRIDRASGEHENMIEITNPYPFGPTEQDVEYEYSFTLTPNPLYTERTGYLNAVDEATGGQNDRVEIIQEGTPLLFNLLSPLPLPAQIDFGTSSDDASIDLWTNATHWIFTTSGAQYSQVVKSTKFASNTVLPGAEDASKKVELSLVLTPHDGASVPENGWAVAGSTVSGSIRVSSAVSVTGITNLKHDVSVSRFMPVYWSVSSWGTTPLTVPVDGATVRVTSPNNTKWDVSGTVGQAVFQSASVYSSKVLSYVIPKNDSWGNRDITLTATGYEVDGTAVFKQESKTYTQLGYAPVFTRDGAGNIPGPGGVITVDIEGLYPSDMQMRVMSGGTTVVAASAVGTTGTRKFTIPANWINTRDLTVEYSNGSVWQRAIEDVTQNVCNATFSRVGSGTIAISGGSLNVSVSGTVPTFNMRVVVDGTTTVVSSPANVSGTTGTRGFTITGDGTGKDRALRVQYQQAPATEWIDTDVTATQTGWITPTFGKPSRSVLPADVAVSFTVSVANAAGEFDMRVANSNGTAVSSVVSGQNGNRALTVTSLNTPDGTSDRTLYIQYYHPVDGWTNTGRTLTQWGVPSGCGYGANAVRQSIGTDRGWTNNGVTNTYLTHAYGGKCWMVQDSRHGTAASTRYGSVSSVIGSGNSLSDKNSHHYYLYSNASTACPAGWRIPNNEEGYKEVNNLRDELAVDYSHAKSQWWAGAAASSAAGSANTNGAWSGYRGSNGNWNGWGAYGEWWYGSTGQYFNGYSSNLGVYTGTYTSDWHSVRCVKD